MFEKYWPRSRSFRRVHASSERLANACRGVIPYLVMRFAMMDG